MPVIISFVGQVLGGSHEPPFSLGPLILRRLLGRDFLSGVRPVKEKGALLIRWCASCLGRGSQTTQQGLPCRLGGENGTSSRPGRTGPGALPRRPWMQPRVRGGKGGGCPRRRSLGRRRGVFGEGGPDNRTKGIVTKMGVRIITPRRYSGRMGKSTCESVRRSYPLISLE